VFVLGLLCQVDPAVPHPSLVATDVVDDALENRYWLDELDTSGVLLPSDGARVLSDLVAGVEVERGGALDSTVRVATRSGMEERRGSAFAYVTPGLLTASPETAPVGTIGVRTELQHELVTGMEMGGPLWRGRAWLWMGVAAQNAVYDVVRTTRRRVDRDSDGLPDVDGHGFFVTEVLDERRIRSPESSAQMVARLDVEPAHGHHGRVMLLVAPEHRDAVRAIGVVEEQQQEFVRTTVDALAQWRSVFGALDVAGSIGLHRTSRLSGSKGRERDDIPLQRLHGAGLGTWSGLGGESGRTAEGCRDSGADPYPLIVNCPDDNSYGYAIGGPGWITDDTEQRFQTRAEVTHRTQRNELGVSALTARDSYADRGHYSGGVFFDNFGNSVWATRSDVARNDVLAHHADVMVHDAWQLDARTVIDLGVRYDHADVTGGAWSPIVALSHGPFWARWSRTTEILPLAPFAEASGWDRFVSDSFADFECGPVIDALGGPDANACRPDPGALHIPVRGVDGEVAADLRAQASDDLAFGAARELSSGLAVGATFQHRALRHVIEDLRVDDVLVIGNPPGAHRSRDALSLGIGYRGVRASYTFSQTRGDYTGLDYPQRAPHLSPQFDGAEFLLNRDGPLPDDRRHQLAIDAAHTHGPVLLGARLRAASGAPLDARAPHPSYGQDETFLLPRGAFGRGDVLADLTLRVGWTQQLGGHRLDLFVDLLHAFDPQTAVTVDQRYTLDRALPILDGDRTDLLWAKSSEGTPIHRNLAFGTAATRQPPTALRFGLRISF
jgi:hypothetical protein